MARSKSGSRKGAENAKRKKTRSRTITMGATEIAMPDEDSEVLSTAERHAVEEADEWLKHNQPIPHEQVLA